MDGRQHINVSLSQGSIIMAEHSFIWKSAGSILVQDNSTETKTLLLGLSSSSRVLQPVKWQERERAHMTSYSLVQNWKSIILLHSIGQKHTRSLRLKHGEIKTML